MNTLQVPDEIVAKAKEMFDLQIKNKVSDEDDWDSITPDWDLNIWWDCFIDDWVADIYKVVDGVVITDKWLTIS